jgi:hypothetical protein
MKQTETIQTIPLERLEKVLSIKARKDLNKFLHGSTVMVRNDKLTGLYMWDFQMWLSHYKP